MNAGKKSRQSKNLDLNAARQARQVLHSRNGTVFTPSENIIYMTTDYGAFRFDPLNRPIDPVHLARLTQAIRQKNLLANFPIVVSSDLTVIDGQHRLRAAMALNVPIYFAISSTMNIMDNPIVASNTDGWTLSNYLQHFCIAMQPEYLKLRDFISAHPWIPASAAANVCTFGALAHSDEYTDERPQNTFFKRFAAGMYQANDIEFGQRVARMVKDFEGVFKGWKHVHFLRALTHMAANSEYDHAHMMKKMQWQSTRLVRCANADAYVALLEEIYNHKVQYQNRVSLARLNPHDPRYRVDRKGKGMN